MFAAIALTACATTPTTPASLLADLKPGTHLTGTPAALTNRLVLNAEDFVYDAKLSPDGRTAALSRLGMKSFHLAIHDVANPPVRRADPAINTLEFDIDTLEFSPDGAHVATVSRDGALRLFSTAGVLEAAWLTEEPLVSVAWHPGGQLLALGSARGLVTLVSFPQLQHVAELRAHADEVRALAFTPGGELVSGSWDKRLLVFTIADGKSVTNEVRTHVEKKNGQVLFRAVLDRAASATVALDVRAPMLVVKSPLAQAAGIEALTLTETTQIQNQFGTQVAKVARKRTLAIKNLVFTDIDVAICDACVPPDAQAVLGGPMLQQVNVAFDDSAKEIVFTVTGTGVSVGSSKTLSLARAFTFPASVNDLSLDAKGTTAGVAFSETKSERTKAVYDREKKGEIEPEREWDCGARVDVATGQVIEKLTGHRGVVATAGISPDGRTLATGGWDKKVLVHAGQKLSAGKFGWAVRRVRFSADGTKLVVAAWTPQNPLGDHQSDPAGVVFEVVYREASVER